MLTLCLFFLLMAQPAWAVPLINYYVTLDTQPLLAAGTPFAIGIRLDHDPATGVGEGGFATDIIDWNFHGGMEVGPYDRFNAVGVLPTDVNVNSGPETPTYLQAFQPGTALSFTVSILGGVIDPEHARLSVAILPLSTTGNPPLIANSLDADGNWLGAVFFQALLDAHVHNGLTDFRTQLLSTNAATVVTGPGQSPIQLSAATTMVTPEPSTLIMVASGLLGLVWVRWKRSV
jgi:hypothetical protein